MWWEILPPMAIMYTAFSAADVFVYYYHYFWNGTPFKRTDYSRYHTYEILRDERLTGKNKGWLSETVRYKFYGLENIPDEPESEMKSDQTKKEC